MFDHHNLHLVDTDVKNKRDLGWHNFLKNVGMGFVTLFIPAVLHFELGISLAGVCLYMVLHSVFALFWIGALSANYVSHHGTKLSMIIGVMGTCLHLLTLILAAQFPILVFLSPVFSGIHTAFFRVAFHSNMSQDASKEGNIGRLNAFIDSAMMIAFIVGPYIGGIIADSYGENIAFLCAIFFVLLSIVPLLASWRKHKPKDFSLHIEMNFIRNNFREFLSIAKTFFGIGYLSVISSLLWPIALFGFFQSYEKVGLLSAITSLIVVVIINVVGSIADKSPEKAKKWIKLSTAVQGTNWLVAGLSVAVGFFSNILFLGLDTFQKITRKLNGSYFNQLFYKVNDTLKDKDFKKGPVYGVVIHELVIHCAKIVFGILGALMFWIVGDNFNYIAIPFILVIAVLPLQLALIFSPKTINM